MEDGEEDCGVVGEEGECVEGHEGVCRASFAIEEEGDQEGSDYQETDYSCAVPGKYGAAEVEAEEEEEGDAQEGECSVPVDC